MKKHWPRASKPLSHSIVSECELAIAAKGRQDFADLVHNGTWGPQRFPVSGFGTEQQEKARAGLLQEPRIASLVPSKRPLPPFAERAITRQTNTATIGRGKSPGIPRATPTLSGACVYKPLDRWGSLGFADGDTLFRGGAEGAKRGGAKRRSTLGSCHEKTSDITSLHKIQTAPPRMSFTIR